MPDPAADTTALIDEFAAIVGREAVIEDEPLSRHTTFEIGGPASLYVSPESTEQLVEVVTACRRLGVPYLVLGCGSDLLVSDSGFGGVVVGLTEALNDVTVDGTRMTCQAGVALKDAAEMASTLSLTGLEFACGIPGSVGGAVYMNAGAYDGETAQVLESVRVLTPEGQVAELGVDELEMGYRASRVRREGLVVLDATFSLKEGDAAEIRALMDDLTERRESKQPLELPSAGSTFKRPPGHFAGKLISDAGLQGLTVGGAQVSTKHAGFVVNLGGATAADVRELVRQVQAAVKEQFGVELEPELLFVGDFGDEA